jgi:hypothetical protein
MLEKASLDDHQRSQHNNQAEEDEATSKQSKTRPASAAAVH